MKQNSGILSIPYELPINSGFVISLKPSNALISIYSLFSILLIVAVIISDIAIWFKLMIFAVMFFYLLQLFKKQLLMTHPRAICQLALTDFNWCFVCYKNNRIFKADILPDSILMEHLVIINLKPQGNKSGLGRLLEYFFGRESVLITRDRVGAEHFRDLKRRLKLIDFKTKSEKTISIGE